MNELHQNCPTTQYNSAQIGDVSEIATQLFLRKLGYHILVPIFDRPYDLAIETSQGVKKVQIKTASYRTDRLVWRANLVDSKGRPYPLCTVDYFAVAAGDIIFFIANSLTPIKTFHSKFLPISNPQLLPAPFS